MNNDSAKKDENIGLIEPYYKKIIRVQTRGDPRSISGELIKITDSHLILKHKDGRTTLIKRSAITVISEMHRQVD
jgi:hypothetical protein